MHRHSGRTQCWQYNTQDTWLACLLSGAHFSCVNVRQMTNDVVSHQPFMQTYNFTFPQYSNIAEKISSTTLHISVHLLSIYVFSQPIFWSLSRLGQILQKLILTKMRKTSYTPGVKSLQYLNNSAVKFPLCQFPKLSIDRTQPSSCIAQKTDRLNKTRNSRIK